MIDSHAPDAQGATPAHAGPPRPLPPVTDHACWLFFSLALPAGAPGPDLRLGALADAQTVSGAEGRPPAGRWIADDALATIVDERRERPIWEPGSLDPGDDLYPYVQRLLGKNQGPDTAATGAAAPPLPHASVWRRGDSARKLLQGECLAYARETPKEDRRPKRLAIRLAKSARKRIAARVPGLDLDTLGISILDLHLVSFRTGLAFLIAEVEVLPPPGQPLHPYPMVEALYALSRVNELTWTRADGIALEGAPEFGLASMVRGLVGQAEGAKRAGRVFTGTYVQFSATPDREALDRLLTQLARHYSDEYLARDHLPGTRTVSHFDNVLHRFAFEGCATALDLGGYGADAVPPFLKEFRDATYRRHYLPIVLLAYHELSFLLQATNEASFWPEPGNRAGDLERMQELRERICAFTLCFRFS